MGLLLRTQRRALAKLQLPKIEDDRISLIIVLRLAVLFHRNHMDVDMPKLKLSRDQDKFKLVLPAEWLAANPLTATELEAEEGYWSDAGVSFVISAN